MSGPPRLFRAEGPGYGTQCRVLELLWWRRDQHMHEGRAQKYTPLTDAEKALLTDFIDFVHYDIAEMIDEAADGAAMRPPVIEGENSRDEPIPSQNLPTGRDGEQ